jgi:hypothetical protein
MCEVFTKYCTMISYLGNFSTAPLLTPLRGGSPHPQRQHSVRTQSKNPSKLGFAVAEAALTRRTISAVGSR